jgi:hypothetical protein
MSQTSLSEISLQLPTKSARFWPMSSCSLASSGNHCPRPPRPCCRGCLIDLHPRLLIPVLYKQGVSDYMDVSWNGGTPKSSILIGFFITNHPFWGTPIYGNPHMGWYRSCLVVCDWSPSCASMIPLRRRGNWSRTFRQLGQRTTPWISWQPVGLALPSLKKHVSHTSFWLRPIVCIYIYIIYIYIYIWHTTSQISTTILYSTSFNHSHLMTTVCGNTHFITFHYLVMSKSYIFFSSVHSPFPEYWLPPRNHGET